jgi:archaellum component FlaD/FlaE
MLLPHVQYYTQLGWIGEDSVTDDRLHALLKRASALKQVS